MGGAQWQGGTPLHGWSIDKIGLQKAVFPQAPPTMGNHGWLSSLGTSGKCYNKYLPRERPTNKP